MDTTMTTAAPMYALTTTRDAASLVTAGHCVASGVTSELMRSRTVVAPMAAVSSTWRAASVAGTGVPAAVIAATKDHGNAKPASPPRGSTG
jgi:hypothetical protein